MCRHLAWLGPARSLSELVLEPVHGLATQAHAPRRQRFGTMNVDGFGAGWYVPERAEPVRYRRAGPIWADASFASLAPTIRSTCVVGAVRSATPGFAADESASAPFTAGRWLLSHNGRVDGLPGRRGVLGDRCADVPDAQAGVDSAVVLGLAARRWLDGEDLGAGLAGAVRDVLEVAADPATARLGLLASDGESLAGTTWAEDLWHVERDGGHLLASEPDGAARDDAAAAAGWRRLPPGSLVRVDARGLSVEPLDVAAGRLPASTDGPGAVAPPAPRRQPA